MKIFWPLSYHGLNNLSYDLVCIIGLKTGSAVLSYNHFRFSLSRFFFVYVRTGLIGSRFASSSVWPFRYFFFQKPLERAIFTLRSQMSREHFLELFLRNLENESFISATLIQKGRNGTLELTQFYILIRWRTLKRTNEHKPDWAFPPL